MVPAPSGGVCLCISAEGHVGTGGERDMPLPALYQKLKCSYA